jgi:amino acid transporter
MQEKKGLAQNALSLGESVVMGVAGTAPAYSAAATTATLIAAVGVLSPGSLLYCGIIMFGVTLAFMQLNRIDPNAGASYAWVTRAFGPGWDSSPVGRCWSLRRCSWSRERSLQQPRRWSFLRRISRAIRSP